VFLAARCFRSVPRWCNLLLPPLVFEAAYIREPSRYSARIIDAGGFLVDDSAGTLIIPFQGARLTEMMYRVCEAAVLTVFGIFHLYSVLIQPAKTQRFAILF